MHLLQRSKSELSDYSLRQDSRCARSNSPRTASLAKALHTVLNTAHPVASQRQFLQRKRRHVSIHQTSMRSGQHDSATHRSAKYLCLCPTGSLQRSLTRIAVGRIGLWSRKDKDCAQDIPRGCSCNTWVVTAAFCLRTSCLDEKGLNRRSIMARATRCVLEATLKNQETPWLARLASWVTSGKGEAI